jgi:hypothetical protein
MQNKPICRRSLIRTLGLCFFAPVLQAAPPFWNRKAPQDWTTDEITQLLGRSPWARETNLDFEATEGGHIENLPTGAPPQPGEKAPRPDAQAGSMSRTPVVVRWESAQPIRDAFQTPMIHAFEGHYVISVSNIPPAAMTRHRAGKHDVAPSQEDMLAELQGAATLEVPGRDPAGAGLIRKVSGSENNYLFGFAKELLPLTGSEKEILFVLHTARVSVKAKFEPKSMIYRGKFAV